MAMLGSPHRVGNSNSVNYVNTTTEVEVGLLVAYDGESLAIASLGQAIGVSHTPIKVAGIQAVTYAGMLVAIQTDSAADMVVEGQPAYLDAATGKVTHTGDAAAKIGVFGKSATTMGRMMLDPNRGVDTPAALVNLNLVGGM